MHAKRLGIELDPHPSGKEGVKDTPTHPAKISASGGHIPRMHEDGDARSSLRIL
jgi:hypothetical protein